MAQQSKAPLDVEEKIQSLAGDIYVQIEEKVAALVSTYIEPAEITDEIIESHLIYQSLKSDFNELEKNFEEANSVHADDTKAYEKQLSDLQAQVANSDGVIDNNKQLNDKLTDAEKNLKEKLDELSELTISFKHLESENKTQLKSLNEVTEQLGESTQKLNTLELSEHTLAKNDKAKAATLEVQNHQISDLTLQLNTITSELDYLKAEHNQQSQSTNKQLLEEKSAIEQYENKINELKHDVMDFEALLSTEAAEKRALEANVQALTQTIVNLEKDQALSIQTLKEKEDLHQTHLVELNKTLSQEKNTVKEYVEQLDAQEIIVEKQIETHNILLDQFEKADMESSKQIEEFGNKVTSLEKDIAKLVVENKDLIKNHEDSIRMIDGYEEEIKYLKDNYANASNDAQEIIKRVEVNKEKQESEFTKARDTIKCLRDENLDLNTKLEKQVTELEDQLREYRLRFEYAQKQLSSQ